MKNQITQKFQSLEVLKERAIRQRTYFLNHLIKTIMFNGVKMFSFRCKSHVKEKNMFGYPLKLILGISRNFCISGYKPK
jgi:hypothetical protein